MHKMVIQSFLAFAASGASQTLLCCRATYPLLSISFIPDWWLKIRLCKMEKRTNKHYLLWPSNQSPRLYYFLLYSFMNRVVFLFLLILTFSSMFIYLWCFIVLLLQVLWCFDASMIFSLAENFYYETHMKQHKGRLKKSSIVCLISELLKIVIYLSNPFKRNKGWLNINCLSEFSVSEAIPKFTTKK